MITSSFRPKAGRFLISEPFSADTNFQRTVVLLVEHGTEGSLGFVLNRQIQSRLHELVSGMDNMDPPVFMGGPVEQNSLHYIHQLGDLPGAREIVPGLYWSGDFESLKERVQHGRVKEEDILFFVGYSGWAPGQLDQELSRKYWIIAPEGSHPLFGDPAANEDMWRTILQQMGTKYKIISNYPVDPRLN
ncbi:YqgE/AlgH family protein [Pontibacter sp. G13]|uniref:YqgE/AlgH family protein n=1 Tax=Pontibacter sp. G13 TaxID=3074898 RepID=UPI002889B455|nr:YqgE/AlgH family protein [Pontibacter sp. G13]WNJ20759.1 YqgE/AlgH family protein [Pontibacter sp. G13]